jgi:nitroimidazol reductase NimA-like FMN-containing flavoprotein (pyridoxamine 5'-phosphate oxidase superfamily)
MTPKRRPGPPPTERARVTREPHRGAYDRATIDRILDEALVCHLGFVDNDQPFVIPTLHARVGDEVFVHGSSASRALEAVEGHPACLTVTLLDGIVLARSVFEHSVNYRSVMLMGCLRRIQQPEDKLAALRAFSEKLVPGRWGDARTPSPQELRATAILALPIAEASAKLRAGPPDDGGGPDARRDVWAGVIPLRTVAGSPERDPRSGASVPLPAYLHAYVASRGT